MLLPKVQLLIGKVTEEIYLLFYKKAFCKNHCEYYIDMHIKGWQGNCDTSKIFVTNLVVSLFQVQVLMDGSFAQKMKNISSADSFPFSVWFYLKFLTKISCGTFQVVGQLLDLIIPFNMSSCEIVQFFRAQMLLKRCCLWDRLLTCLQISV